MLLQKMPSSVNDMMVPPLKASTYLRATGQARPRPLRSTDRPETAEERLTARARPVWSLPHYAVRQWFVQISLGLRIADVYPQQQVRGHLRQQVHTKTEPATERNTL